MREKVKKPLQHSDLQGIDLSQGFTPKRLLRVACCGSKADGAVRVAGKACKSVVKLPTSGARPASLRAISPRSSRFALSTDW